MRLSNETQQLINNRIDSMLQEIADTVYTEMLEKGYNVNLSEFWTEQDERLIEASELIINIIEGK